MSFQSNSNGASHGGKLVAVLGPTNTGKTHLAIERMLGPVENRPLVSVPVARDRVR